MKIYGNIAADSFRNAKSVGAPKKNQKKGSVPSSKPIKDTVELSQSSKTSRAAYLQDIRKKVDSGFYFSKEVREDISHKLAQRMDSYTD